MSVNPETGVERAVAAAEFEAKKQLEDLYEAVAPLMNGKVPRAVLSVCGSLVAQTIKASPRELREEVLRDFVSTLVADVVSAPDTIQTPKH
jgi:hypothetical protein